MGVNVTELHLHTDKSLMDGLNTPPEYFKRAKELGMTHLAVTDHGTLSAHREFQKAAEEAGIRPILGCEMYISETDRFDRRAVAKRDDDTQLFNHLTVLAKDAKGLHNLNELSGRAWKEGFHYKPRIDFELLEEYADGLIVVSGCLNGLIAKAIQNNKVEQANQWTREFKRVFGDRFFIEIQGHNPPEINAGLLEMAKKYGVKPVVTSDCHYARKEDLWIEDALLILSTAKQSDKAKSIDFSKSQKMDLMERLNYIWPNRKMTFQEFEIFLRSYNDHKDLLAAQGIGEEPIKNTMLVADMIEDYPYYEGLDLLPRPKEGDADEIFERLCWEGLKSRGMDKDPKAVEQLKFEIDVIKKMNFSLYFLPLIKAVHWAHDNDIMTGPGRGSGAGSLALYALRVTEVNPLEHNLLFFRFLNPERNDEPDVDMDFEIHRRREVKAMLLREFEHVASIATFGRFMGKNCVKDASRVFDIPLGEVNRALKGADWEKDFWDHWPKTERGREFIKKYPDAAKLAKYLFGRVKSIGMHPGGVVLSKEPIANHAPIQSATDSHDDAGGRVPLVALDMNAAAEVGFIKYDILGVSALTVIHDTLKLIKERHGKDIDLKKLTYDDPKIYKNLSAGHTRGVFQCDAMPYTNLLLKTGVRDFKELVASNALVRPGAANSSAGASFIARMHGQEAVTYHHPDMRWFTEETYGVVIYQEQVMLTMTELAGMSMAEADKVRKIIGKKREVAEFDEYKQKFIEGASTKVLPYVAEQLWHDFEAHAGYSFNKSHAVAYSMLSYWTAWLKEYYTIEYLASLLKNEEDKDKRLDFLMEAKRLGIRMALPHVNESDINFSIQSDKDGEFIRFGLSNIKFISGKIGNRLLELRPFPNYAKLKEIADTPKTGISTKVTSSLNAVGAAAFPDNPLKGNERDSFYDYLNIPAFQTKDLTPRVKSQLRPLDEYAEDETFVCMGMVRGIKTGPGWARVDIVDETAGAGIFAEEHTPIEKGQMYVFLVSNNRIARYVSFKDLSEQEGGGFQFFLERESFPEVPPGMHVVVSFKSRITKAGNKMADVVFSDENKNLTSAIVFPQMFMKAYSKLKEGAVVDVLLLPNRDGKGLHVENVL